jgi:RND superfamily putative drug exporter
MGRFVVRRAWWVIGGWLVGAVLIIGLLPSLSDITRGDQGSFLPDSYESVQAINLAKTAFPQQSTSTAVVVVKRPDGAADGTVARFSLLLNVNPTSNEAITLVHDHLRGDLHAIAPPGTRVLVGGTTAIFADVNSANNRDLSVILPVAALIIAVILALLLRSVVAPVYLVLAVLLNFAATLGAAIYLFQGVAGRPGVTFQLPIVLYLFVLAIGTDYNILMIARLREEARAGNDPRTAAALGLRHAGPSVAAAGLILAGTFGVLALAPVSFLQQIGFSVAAGILLAAFVMSMFLVPSLTALTGHTAWWPGHGDVNGGGATTTPGQPEPGRVTLTHADHWRPNGIGWAERLGPPVTAALPLA